MAVKGCGDPGDPFVITIEVDDAGNFTYHPALLRVKRGQSVTFDSPHRFRASFGSRTPFDGVLEFTNGTGGRVTAKIDLGAALGVYKYGVVVLSADAQLFMDGFCPEIIVT